MKVKKEVEEMKQQSFATQILNDYKKANKRMFIIIIILIIAFIGLLGYTIYLLNDIGTEVTTEETQTYEMDAENGINNVIGGDNNGTNEVHKN